jgi:hypothetical protein
MQKRSRGTSILVVGVLSLTSAMYVAAYLLAINSIAEIPELWQRILGPLCILSIGSAVILGPAAWIMAVAALRQIRAGVRDLASSRRVKAGLICGAITTGLLILGGLSLAAGIVLVMMVKPGR